MTLSITKHQAALLQKRQAVCAAAQAAQGYAEQTSKAAMAALSDVIVALAADGDFPEGVDIEQFTIEPKGDSHMLTLIEKPKQTTAQAG